MFLNTIFQSLANSANSGGSVAADLGLTGNNPAGGESEEQRRRRLQQGSLNGLFAGGYRSMAARHLLGQGGMFGG